MNALLVIPRPSTAIFAFIGPRALIRARPHWPEAALEAYMQETVLTDELRVLGREEELDAALWKVIDSRVYRLLRHQVGELVSADDFLDLARSTPAPTAAILRAAGSRNANRMGRIAETVGFIARAVMQLVAPHGTEERPIDLDRPLGPSASLAHSDVPRTVVTTLFDLELATASVPALSALGHEAEPEESQRWLHAALVNRIERGFRRYLTLLASITGVIVPDRLVDERLQLTASPHGKTASGGGLDDV